MAIRDEHDPKNRGLSGRFRKAKAKAGRITSGAGSFARDYADEYDRHIKSQGDTSGALLTTLTATLGTLGGMAVGLVAGGVVSMTAQPDIENAELSYGIEEAQGHEAIRTAHGTYALIHEGGEYHLYKQNGQSDVLIYTQNVGDALEIMDRVTDQLQATLEEFQSGEFESADLPAFIGYTDISQSYLDRYSDGVYVIRSFEERVTPDEARNYSVALADALEDWEAAQNFMMTNEYGLTAAERDVLPDADAGERAFGITLLSMTGLGALGGLFFPAGYTMAQTVRRRRKLAPKVS